MNPDKILGAIFGVFISAIIAIVAFKPVNVELLRSQTVYVDMGIGHGSGVIIGPDRVLTADHVVRDLPKNANLSVVFFNGEKVPATIEWEDTNSDTALIKVAVPKGYKFAPLECKKPSTYQPIIVVGNPLDMQWTVSNGVIVTDRPITLNPLKLPDSMPQITKDKIKVIYERVKKKIATVIPFSAIVAPGSSGGPVFDSAGRVLGNVTSILMEQFEEADNGQASSFNTMTPSIFACEHLKHG